MHFHRRVSLRSGVMYQSINVTSACLEYDLSISGLGLQCLSSLTPVCLSAGPAGSIVSREGNLHQPSVSSTSTNVSQSQILPFSRLIFLRCRGIEAIQVSTRWAFWCSSYLSNSKWTQSAYFSVVAAPTSASPRVGGSREITPHSPLAILTEALQHLLGIDPRLAHQYLRRFYNLLRCSTLDHFCLQCECNVVEDLCRFRENGGILSRNVR